MLKKEQDLRKPKKEILAGYVEPHNKSKRSDENKKGEARPAKNLP